MLEGSKCFRHYYELDFEDIDQVNILGTFDDSTHYHRFYFGGLKQEDLGYRWGEVGKWHKNQKAELDPRIVYAIEFNNSNCVLSYNGLEDEKVQTFNISKCRGSVSLSYPHKHVISLRSSFAVSIQLGYICTFYFSQSLVVKILI